jgi:hypothetical protein
MPNSPLSWEIESKKIWLKQLKAAPALDFSYFQHVSKLVTHDTENPVTTTVTEVFHIRFLACQNCPFPLESPLILDKENRPLYNKPHVVEAQTTSVRRRTWQRS